MVGMASTRRKIVDRHTARAAAYRGSENPFPEGTRTHRYFIKERARYDQLEARERDIYLAYGFEPPGTVCVPAK